MAVVQFIPKVWSARILQKLRATLVFGQSSVVNTDFQGEISQFGDTVHVHGHSDVTVSPYARNTTTLAYQLLNDERRSLVIDQSDYFAVSHDDLDAAQVKPKLLDSVSQDAAYQLARVQDTFIANLGVAGAGSVIEGAANASRQITTANAYTTFVEASVRMDEANIPEDGRFAIVPPWMAGVLLQDDRYFLSAQGDAILNAQIGTIAGISILKSNRVPFSGTAPAVYNVLIGHSMAISFASQLSKVEGLRAVNSFADLLRGLTLYGGKVMYPEALIKLRASK